MASPQEQLNMNIGSNIASSELKPIFADSTAIALRVKAMKNDKGEIKKEGFVEIIFIDMMTQKPVGEFVVSENTAKELVIGLNQNITNLEKQLASKDLPEPPKVNPIGDNSSYR